MKTIDKKYIPTSVIWVRVVWFVAAPWLVEGPRADQVQLMLASLPHLLIISSPAIMMRKPDIVTLQSHRRQYVTSSSFAALFHVYCMLGQGSNRRRYLRHYEDNDKIALCNAKSWFEPFCKAIINMYLIRLKLNF